MVTFSEYTKKKKKQNTSFREHTESVLGITLEDDIAPVKSTIDVKESTQKNSYLQKGALSDGFSLKNLTSGLKATEADMEEDATKGILGLGERVWDGLVSLAPYMAKANYYQNGGNLDFEADRIFNEAIEDSKKGIAEYVAKDLIDEEKIARRIVTEPFESKTGIDMEASSFFGSKGDELVQSASDMLVRQGLNYVVPGSGLVLTGLSSLGGETENALKQGAKYEDAVLSGLISAGAEVGTEKIAGIKFGGKTLTDGVAKSIARKVPNKVLGTLAKWGFNTIGEGAEEVIAGKMTAVGQKLTYASDKELDELFSNEDAWESFVAGAILGGVFEGASVATSNLKGVDYVTEVDKNEQKVIDAVYNEMLSERETDGKKLTHSEKNKLYESVEKALDKGYIDIDTIEKTLGGETYKAYKDTVDKEDALMKEYEDLGNVSNPTLAQTTRYNELTQQVKDIKENSKRNQLKDQLSNEVFSVAQSSRLAESYNEKARRSKVFEADLAKYDAKQQEVVKKAIDSGILNNTNRTHEFVDMVAKISADKGVLFDFANNEKLKESGFAIGDKTINGFVKDGNVTLNIDSAKSLNSVVGHEITHVLEGTELYGELQSVVTDFAKTKGEYDARYQELAKLYEGVEGANVDAELVADLVGDYLFTDENFINNLSAEKPNIFKRIYNEIKYLYKVATSGSKEARELEKVKKAFERAYQRTDVSNEAREFFDTDVKYSIRKEAPPKKTIEGYKVFIVKDGKLYPPMVANPEGEGTPVGVWLDADVGGLAYDENGNVQLNDRGRFKVKAGGKGTQGSSGELAFRPGWHLGEYPDASQFGRGNEENLVPNKDGKLKPAKELFPYNFVWARCEVAADNDYQLDAMSFGVNEKGNFERTQAGLPYIPEDGYYKYRTNANPDTAPWIISGSIKVVEILDDDQVAKICAEHGVIPQKRQGFTKNVKESWKSKDALIEELKSVGIKVAKSAKTDVVRKLYSDTFLNGEIPTETVYTEEARPGDKIDLSMFGLKAGQVVPTSEDALNQIRQTEGTAASRKKETAELLKTLPSYTKRQINFDDANIIKEFGMNNQDVESYRQKAELSDHKYLQDDKIYSSNVKYSISDSEGKQLSKVQQEYFKDSKVRDENGNLKVMYHGTPNEFTVFNPLLQGGKNGTAEGYGIYFTDVAEVTESYGDKTMSGYLNITHPARADKKTIKRSDLVKLLKATTEMEAKQLVDDGEYDNVKDALRDTWVSNYVDTYSATMSEAYKECADSILSMNDNDMSIIQEVMAGMAVRDYEDAYKFYDVLKNTIGIDGYITEWNSDLLPGGKAQIVVAFDSNQFKNLDNANPTYDPDIRYDLSTGKGKVHGNYNVYGKDIRLDVPTTETETQIPVEETQMESEIAPTTQIDYGPLTEAEAIARDDKQIDEHYFLDNIAPETEEYYNGDFADHVKPADPFYEKDIFEVSDRKVKAYMYENPEVKPFFQEEARYMLGELDNSQKGERFYNDQLYYDTNGEMGYFGTKRHTSEDIAYLLDTFNYTYKDIAKGLNAIIEDNGKENNAISKRIEFLLDERLRTGYTDFWFGDKIPPNQEYINLLNEKQVTEYSDESWNEWLRSLTEEDIKQYFSASERVEEIAPPKEEVPLYDARSGNGVVEGQQSMFEETETQETEKTRKTLHADIVDSIYNAFNSKGFDFDEVLNNAKNLSTFSTVDNTPQRVMEKALGYKEGQILSDLTVNKVAQNETEGIKWLNSFTNRKNGLLAQISKQYHIKPGSKESAAAQMYAEGFYVNEMNEIIKYGDEELAKDFPSLNVQANIIGLAKDARIRQIYDETLAMINKSRSRNLYPEIPKLDNYFLHFRAMDDTFSRLGLPFNPNDIRAKDLPTDLNGVTADLKPGQPYFASAMHRRGQRTSFDLLGGLERYLASAKNQIYHIDDIQTLRALRNHIADTYGQANGLEGLDALSEDEAQERIKEVYGAHLSTFAKFLNEEANILAGKTALIDRGLEGIIGRRGITFLDTVNKQVGSNMVGFNLSSSLTNFLPVAQTFAKTNKADFVKAFAQTASNKITSIFGRNDGFAEQSPVMIRRKGADRFYRTPFQKIGDTGYVFMSAVDDISTELVARTKYNELVRKGMDSQKAHYETDKWVSRLMGDRSLGQMPQLYNSKMLGLITKFQLEVRNQLDSQFYDTIQETKVSNEHIQNGLERNAKTAAKVASTFVQLAVVQHLFGKAFESVAGYNPAFDIIEVLLKAVGYDDEEDSEDTVLDNIEQGFLTLLEDLPYTSTLTGGRIPISTALPVEELVTGKDEYGNEKSRLTTLKEIAPYYVLPTGYGQIKKSAKGLGMFDDDLPIAGSYTDSGNLRYPVEDTLGNRVQAGLFGQYANDNARDYFDNERNPLKEKQIQELVDLDMPIRDYWDYREGLSKQETLEDKFDYIADLDVSVEQKNIMINNVVDRKEKVDMSNYDDFANYEEFDFYSKNTEKYNFLQDNGISYSEYKADKKKKEEYDNIYSWYKNNPEKVTVSKAVTDNVIEYKRFTSELNDIRADKDSNGDSIAGSAKAKKIDYINGLDLDYGQKIILLRSYYDSDKDKETYNADIVDYLNSREDLSYDEIVTILEELDFKVYSDGTVEW